MFWGNKSIHVFCQVWAGCLPCLLCPLLGANMPGLPKVPDP